MDIKWISDGKVEIGSFCTAQGLHRLACDWFNAAELSYQRCHPTTWRDRCSHHDLGTFVVFLVTGLR